MPRFEPFTGLRYATSKVDLDDVSAPPYDVISDSDRDALESLSPYNAVRVELARDEAGCDRYESARRALDAWTDDGVLRYDDTPCFYGYRMEFTDERGRSRTTIGVIGALALEEPGAGDILPHERTMPKPKGDRLNLLRTCRANLSPIWGLSMTEGLSGLLTPPHDGVESCTDEDGVRHSVWAISDADAILAISAAVAETPVVIADGHHRFETALAYQRERREESGDAPGDYDLLMTLVVELAEDQLSVRAIHRLLRGFPPGFDVLGALRPWFDAGENVPVGAELIGRMEDEGALALVLPGGARLLRPRPDALAGAEHDLDSSRLDVARESLPPHEVVYQHGWNHVVRAVDSREYEAGVLLRPARVDQIAAVGRARDRMPEKTTFFFPKPRTGLVFRRLSP